MTLRDVQHEPPDIGDLYRRFSGLVYRRARRFFDDAEAEEVVHEVFLKVMEKIDVFRQQSSPVRWLHRVTTNYCLNRVRDSKRRRELLAEQSPFLKRRATQDPNQADSAFLSDLWRRLPEDLVQIGVYHWVDGMTNPEIANMLGCSPRTVVNRLQALRKAVEAL